MKDTYKLLIIEDDRDMAEALQNLLVKWKFKTVICRNFDDILTIFGEEEPHIILMDINIPSFDGFYWCKKIREISSVPIIFCSSRNSNMDIVMVINNGGDDYIQKPFDSHVLVAKLQAIIRRTYEYRTTESQLIKSNDVILNLNDAKIYYQDQSLELTKNEFRILKPLMENKGEVVSRDKLMRKLWNDDIYVNENTLRNRLENINVHDFIIIIKDNGIGISKEDLSRIFNKGFTGENGEIGTKSTGMSLYYAKKMAKKLSVGINVESKEGEYTEFSVVFYKLYDYYKTSNEAMHI